MEPHRNVITEIVNASMCIGCGVCAAVCPHNTLCMTMSAQGNYQPINAGHSCAEKCRLCLKVCPFAENNLNEDALADSLFSSIPQIRYSRITGYHLNSYAGYSVIQEHRAKGASGGLATWTLETLLQERLVDHIVCVKSTSDCSRLFEFTVCTRTDQVRECGRSCYYPVEIQDAIKYILNQEGRYAVIGLPCVCKAIRLAQKQIPALSHRIRFLFGLVCGQSKNRHFVDALCFSKLPDFQSLRQVQFRIKTPGRKVRDFGVSFEYLDSQGILRQQTLHWSEGIAAMWNEGMFTPNPCFFCDDIFAECADATFMDAWHKDYESDPNGNSIVLIRNRLLQDLFNKFHNEQLAISKIPISKTILSQMSVVLSKRTDLRHRINLLSRPRKRHLVKRTGLFRRTLHPCRSGLAQTLHKVALQSNLYWSEHPGDIAFLEYSISPLRQKIQRYKKQLRYFRPLSWLCNQIACRM
jgi:coenzyme F420 hydrogenase subunit beta